MDSNQSKTEQQNLRANNSNEQSEQHHSIDSIKASYGENFHAHLLEQYKMYVEMMDRVSARRVQNNTFYISLLSGLLAFLSLVVDKTKNLFIDYEYLLLAVAILGLVLCYIWRTNINSYKQLNSLKFKVIHETEKQLPFSCYYIEWEILKQEKKNQEYRRLSNIEKSVPFVLGIPYLVLLIYSLYILST